jgi:hypothetical protein
MRRATAPSAAVAVLAAATVVSAALSPVALADSHSTGSGITKQRLMTKKDVPAVLGRTTSYGFTNRTVDRSLGICEDSNGKVVAIVAPPRQASVDIENKSTTAAPYSSESEVAYQFDGTPSATAAFADLKAAAAACPGVTTGKEQSSTDTGVTVTTTLSTGTASAGAAGAAVWVQESVVYNAPKGSVEYGAKTVVYRVFSQPGDAILETQFYVNGASSISPAQVAAVQQLAAGNSMRWMAR